MCLLRNFADKLLSNGKRESSEIFAGRSADADAAYRNFSSRSVDSFGSWIQKCPKTNGDVICICNGNFADKLLSNRKRESSEIFAGRSVDADAAYRNFSSRLVDSFGSWIKKCPKTNGDVICLCTETSITNSSRTVNARAARFLQDVLPMPMQLIGTFRRDW